MSAHPTLTSRSPRSGHATAPPAPLWLPGQAAAHPGPIDLSTMYLMHHGFRRDLASFAWAAHVTPVGDREAWRALSERWALFAAVRNRHHRGEDAGLWPALLARSDADARAVLHDMATEHTEIDVVVGCCASGFERLLRAPDVDGRIALADNLEAAKARVGRHLDREETETLAIVQEVLLAAEWTAIEQEHLTGSLPQREVRSLVPWMLHDVPAATRREVLAHFGAGHRTIWRLTHGAFERRERSTFRYLD